MLFQIQENPKQAFRTFPSRKACQLQKLSQAHLSTEEYPPLYLFPVTQAWPVLMFAANGRKNFVTYLCSQHSNVSIWSLECYTIPSPSWTALQRLSLFSRLHIIPSLMWQKISESLQFMHVSFYSETVKVSE